MLWALVDELGWDFHQMAVQFTFYGTSEMVQLRYHYILFVIRYKAK
jgi:hypothetical protein